MTQALIEPWINSTLAFGLPGGAEWVMIFLIGLLIFGRRLPEVGRSLGKGIVEFKRGLRGLDEDAGVSEEMGELRDAVREATTLETKPHSGVTGSDAKASTVGGGEASNSGNG